MASAPPRSPYFASAWAEFSTVFRSVGSWAVESPLAPFACGVLILCVGLGYAYWEKRCAQCALRLYSSESYWDRRYAQLWRAGITASDWYFLDNTVVDLVRAMAGPDFGIHDMGCGSSELCEMLRDAGFTRLSASDFSRKCVDARIAAERRTADAIPAIVFQHIDLRDAGPATRDVDLYVDKATLDSVLWPKTRRAKADAHAVLDRVARTLRPGGKLLSFSLHPDSIWEAFCAHPALVRMGATLRLVRRVPGQPRPINIYVRRYVLQSC